MTPRAKELLDKLLRTRPKPSDQALRDLFMAIQSTPLQDLMKLVRGGGSVPSETGSSVLASAEADIKRRLRKVGGKASDFLPYLFDAISNVAPAGTKPPRSKGITLSKALVFARSVTGDAMATVVEKAMATYISENDVSYRLKSA